MPEVSFANLVVAATAMVFSGSAFAVDRLVPQQYQTIQAAIDASANGDVVQVSPGSHPGPVDLRGKMIVLRGTTSPEMTIVTGGGSVLRCASGELQSTVIENLTFANGGADRGGGAFLLGSSPVIRNCRFSGNAAGSQGGGMYIEGGMPRIEGCMIAANTIQVGLGFGAGICVANSSAIVVDCLISGNLITGSVGNSCGGGKGAGVFVSGAAAPTFERCTIAGNQNTVFATGCCTTIGPGATFEGPANVTDCVIRDNSAVGCGNPAAVNFSNNSVYVRGTKICGNTGPTQTTGAFVSLGGNVISATCPITCPGDLNSDGFVDGDDLGRLLSNWGPCTN